MLDARYVADHLDEVRAQLARRGPEAAQALDGLVDLVSARRELTRKTELSQAERNSASELMGKLAKSGDKEGMAARREELKALSERVKGLETELAGIEAQIEDRLLEIPNVPHPTVPEGKGEADNTVIRTWGVKPSFDFEPNGDRTTRGVWHGCDGPGRRACTLVTQVFALRNYRLQPASGVTFGVGVGMGVGF